jgi:hypothetical protein
VVNVSSQAILKTTFITMVGLSQLSGAAQEVELKGEIKCGATVNGGQGYSQPISIRIKDGYGTGISETTETLENQELVITADGSVRYNAIGIDLPPPCRTKVMEQSPLISENSGYETIQIYR